MVEDEVRHDNYVEPASVRYLLLHFEDWLQSFPPDVALNIASEYAKDYCDGSIIHAYHNVCVLLLRRCDVLLYIMLQII